MPIYEYEVLDQAGNPKGIFETMRKMSDPDLTRHPVTGEPVRRILSRTFVGSGQSDGEGSYAGGACASGTCGIPSSGGCAGGSCGWD
jgi:predicted nucleic acid-binding Zn ribbon protein